MPQPSARAALAAAGMFACVGVFCRPVTARAQGSEPAAPVSPKVIVVGPGGTMHVEGEEGPAAAAASPARRAAAVRSVSPAQVAALVRRQRGRPTVVVLYGAACSRSKAALPALLELARRGEGAGATVLAVGVNGTADDYAAFHAAIPTPHDPLRVGRYVPGEFAGAMAPFGITIPTNGYSLPLVAVLGGDGRAVGQWQVTSRDEMAAALQAAAGAFGVER